MIGDLEPAKLAVAAAGEEAGVDEIPEDILAAVEQACDLVVGASPFEQQFERFDFRTDPSLMEEA
jgi:hypothetical protein